MIKHFEDYVDRVFNIQKIDKQELIVDVGSNDGTLLRCFKNRGFNNILGVDPASEIVRSGQSIRH